MKRLFATAVAGGLLAAGAWLVPLHANTSDCPDGVGGIGGEPGTEGTVTVGVNEGPVQGCVTGSGSANPPSGFLVADGKAEPNPEPLDGYIGVTSDGQSLTVVGCAEGNFDDEGKAPNPIVSVGPGGVNPFPPSPPDPNSECSPKPTLPE